MAIGSGLGAQLGFKKETTYGTPVTVTNFLPFNSEGINFDRNKQYSSGLQAGQLFQASTRAVTTTRSGAGPIAMDVPTKGFGFWPDLLVAPVITPAVVVGTAFKSTFNIGASDLTKSATVQLGSPGTSGVVQPYTYTSAVPTAFSLEQSVGGFLTSTIQLDVQDRLTATALATASYPANNSVFHFGQCVPTINSVATTDVFDSVKVDINFSRKVDRFRIGGSGKKAQPITNGFTDGEIEFSGDFKDLTFNALYDADTIFPVVLTWTSNLLADSGGTPYSVTLTAAACQMSGDDPNVAGEDLLTQTVKCKVLNDGTNPPIKLEIVSTDSAAW